jgi:putative nucleotidyltransferase with HDIG domain
MGTLFSKLKAAFEIPFDPLNESTNKDNILCGLLNMITLIAVVYVAPSIILRGLNSPLSYSVLLLVVVFILLRLAVSRGYTKFASYTLLMVLWSVVVFMFIFYENGLRAPAYSAFLAFIIAYAGLLHGRKMAWIVTIVSLLVSAMVFAAEMQGVYLVEPIIPDIRFVLIGQIVFFIGIAYMLTKTLGNFQKSILLYREEAESRRAAEQKVIRLHRELEVAYETTLDGWASALELRDQETEGHSRRVTDLTLKLGEQMGMGERDLQLLRYGALLHDIGKMGVPDNVLRKPGELNPEERKMIEMHPWFAYKLLKDIRYLEKAVTIPYSHHEYWDGSGYPQGLKGEDIPLPARIFSIVDHWDALRSDRPYREAWPREKVIDYIRQNSGVKFDPFLVELFLESVVGLDSA